MSAGSTDVSAIYELLYNPKYIPERSPSAHADQMMIEGESTFIVSKESGEYFEIDETTNHIWNLMDGRRSVSQILEEARKFDEKITEKSVKDVIVSFAEEGLVASTEAEVVEKRVEMVSTFQLDIRLVKDSSKTLAGFFKFTRKFLRREELYVASAIIIVGIVLFAGTFAEILTDPTKLEILGSTLLGLFFYEEIVLLPVYLIHELAHAAACDYYGGRPRELGTGLYYFAPFFYCDTSDAFRLGRRARIVISLAGPLSTMVMGSIFVFASFFVNLGFGRVVLEVAAFFCYYGSLANFSPVIETDGYYVLSDVLKMPNLRDESLGYLKRAFLRILGRPVKRVRYSAKRKRILAVYSIITVAWLIFFGYSTVRLTYFYSLSAYSALLSLFQMLIGIRSISAFGISVSLASLFYFAFLMVGYLIMGVVAYRKIRFRGAKLETIQDKRVSIFLPLPSFLERSRAMQLVVAARSLSRKFTHRFSVVWEPPLCVAALKLGRADETLDNVRREMNSTEKSLRTLHSRFLTNNISSYAKEADSKKLRQLLKNLVSQFPSLERKEILNELSKFFERQDTLMNYVLNSAFGTVWSFEFSPSDYKRLRRELFPMLIAEDLGMTDLSGETEHFKRHTVLGLDAVAKLSSELDKETSRVLRNPELYQATAFIEPVKSRLVFVGRTEGVERSIVWLGGLFLYQAWAGYIKEVLYETTLGLSSMRQGPLASFSKSQVGKLSSEELAFIRESLGQLELLKRSVNESLLRLRSTYQSAKNFQESLVSLLDDQNFDLGLYKPILSSNDEHLAGVKEKIDYFEEEYSRVCAQLDKAEQDANELYQKKANEVSTAKRSRSLQMVLLNILNFGRGTRYSQIYYSEARLLFSTSRLLYRVVIASDFVI